MTLSARLVRWAAVLVLMATAGPRLAATAEVAWGCRAILAAKRSRNVQRYETARDSFLNALRWQPDNQRAKAGLQVLAITMGMPAAGAAWLDPDAGTTPLEHWRRLPILATMDPAAFIEEYRRVDTPMLRFAFREAAAGAEIVTAGPDRSAIIAGAQRSLETWPANLCAYAAIAVSGSPDQPSALDALAEGRFDGTHSDQLIYASCLDRWLPSLFSARPDLQWSVRALLGSGTRRLDGEIPVGSGASNLLRNGGFELGTGLGPFVPLAFERAGAADGFVVARRAGSKAIVFAPADRAAELRQRVVMPVGARFLTVQGSLWAESNGDPNAGVAVYVYWFEADGRPRGFSQVLSGLSAFPAPREFRRTITVPGAASWAVVAFTNTAPFRVGLDDVAAWVSLDESGAEP